MENAQIRQGRFGYLLLKRSCDIIGALLGLLLSTLPMLVISVIIRLDSEGPVLYRQTRLGKDGVPFTIYKFRTMEADAEKDGPKWADTDDVRCTRAGRILRQSRLDELPQFFNILRGEMSLVGPRPEREYFYKKFEETIPYYRSRMQVKPGLTGLAQVKGGYELSPEEKIVFDMKYIEEQSLWLDLWCISRTLKLVFTHEGAR